jgi:hypothetical protein
VVISATRHKGTAPRTATPPNAARPAASGKRVLDVSTTEKLPVDVSRDPAGSEFFRGSIPEGAPPKITQRVLECRIYG